jgi:hypothetical protein
MRLVYRLFLVLVSLFIVTSIFSQPVASPGSPLVGTWQHQKDSGGWKANAGANITLRLEDDGQAVLLATAPKQEPLEVYGTWSGNGGKVTINIPDQFEIKSQAWQLKVDTLVLPSQLSDDKPGSSTWVRLAAQPLDVVFAVFSRSIGEGDSSTEAAEKAAAEARKAKDVESVVVQKQGVGLEITLKPAEPTGPKPKVLVIFATKPAPLVTPVVQRKMPMSPLATDPRTHLDAANPAGDPDAPAARTALVISPFHSKTYKAYSEATWVRKGTKQKLLPAASAKTSTFGELGDDPEFIATELRKAGFEVTLLVDDQASPGPIFRALQAHPSIIYYSTHGGASGEGTNSLASAGIIGVHSMEGRPNFLTRETALAALKALLDKEGIPEAARGGVSIGAIDPGNGFSFLFPQLWPKFFEEALGKGTPQTFVYLDSCFSGDSPSLARALNAKAFIGSKSTVAGWASARFAKYVFKNMIHKGHSVREAWDRLRNVCHGSYVVYVEDSIASPVAKGDVDMAVECDNLVAWGLDQKPYEKVTSGTFTLMRMARWASNDINSGADSLKRCYNLFWKTGKRPGIGEGFCTQGVTDHTPTGPEVEDACHLVSGKPEEPAGRFVVR